MTNLKTDYAAGDTLPAADVNAANVKINTHEGAIADHEGDEENPHAVTAEQAGATPASHASATDNPHDVTFAQLTDVINTARAENKMIQVDADGKLVFVDAPSGGSSLAFSCAVQSVNQNLTTSYAVASYGTEKCDSGDNYSVTTKKFTVPADGFYSVFASNYFYDFTAGDLLHLAIRKNSDIVIFLNESRLSHPAAICVSGVYEFEEDDTIEVVVKNGSAARGKLIGGMNTGTFSVVQVG